MKTLSEDPTVAVPRDGTRINTMVNQLRNRIREAIERRLRFPTIPTSLARVARIGFCPTHVLDVGAYRGEFAADCLRIWPETTVTCFEPQQEQEAYLQSLKHQFPQRVHYHMCAIGATNQDAVTLFRAETASSLLKEHHSVHPRAQCSMRTLDTCIDTSTEPDLLKMDVQGYEHEVLKGATSTLQSIRVLLAEVNLLDIHESVPLFGELIEWLGQRGFLAYDICGLTRRPLDDALWQVDVMFVPATSELRVDKRWAA